MRRTELTDHPFDPKRFKEILNKAKGDRSQAQFASDCDLSYAYINKYSNGKFNDAPTINTIKKIAVATRTVTYEELLEAAGYDHKKYEKDRPVGSYRKDFIYPVMVGIANSPYDWSIESNGYKDQKPFEIIIEKQDIKKWYFVPVLENVSKELLLNILLSEGMFDAESKVSFITDDEKIFNKLATFEFPLLSLYLSAIRVTGTEIVEEVPLKSTLSTNMSIKNTDRIRMYAIGDM